MIGTGASASFQSTVGSTLNPKAAYNDIRRALRSETRDILSGFSGVVRPREMLRKSHLCCLDFDENLTRATVVLGSPGSGCTTFLKMLANHRETYRDVQGEVYYDSLTPDEIKAHSRGDLQVRFLIQPPLPQSDLAPIVHPRRRHPFPHTHGGRNAPVRCKDSYPSCSPRWYVQGGPHRPYHKHLDDRHWLEPPPEHPDRRRDTPWSIRW